MIWCAPLSSLVLSCAAQFSLRTLSELFRQVAVFCGATYTVLICCSPFVNTTIAGWIWYQARDLIVSARIFRSILWRAQNI